MLRLGPSETVVFQSARSTGPVTPRGDERLRVVIGAATSMARTRPRSWPSSCGPSATPPRCRTSRRPTGRGCRRCRLRSPSRRAAGAVGLVDVPAEQRRGELRWAPANGNLALLGAFGAGTTTALISLLLAACDGTSADVRHVYVLDARGDERLDGLGRLPHCAGVVRPHERERLARLLQRLVEQLDRRRASGGREGGPAIILAVDGISALRATLDAPTDATRVRRNCCASSPRARRWASSRSSRPSVPARVPTAVLAACAERWVFHLDDPSEASACGVRAVAVPAAIPGRIVVASTGHEAQLASRRVEPSLGERSRTARRRSVCSRRSSMPPRCQQAR